MTHTPRPPCPYCGECQSYDEARPAKPRVVQGEYDPRTRRYRKTTYYGTDCRQCGQQILWSCLLGEFSFDLARFTAAKQNGKYHWSKPCEPKR